MKTETTHLHEDCLCGCSFIHPGKSLREGLELVQQLGLHHVDIAVGGANTHFSTIAVAEKPEYFAERVRRECDERNLSPNECFALNFGWPINSPHQSQRQRTKELFNGLCRFASLAGFRSLLLIPGPVHSEIGPQASLDLAIEACRELSILATANGLRLNIEADCDSCASIPEAALALCEAVPGLGLTLDYSHFICQSIVASRIEQLHPYTRHLHIRQAAPGAIVTDVREGTIDYRSVLSQLESKGYRGLFCIEYLSPESNEQTMKISEMRTLAMKQHIEECFKEYPCR